MRWPATTYADRGGLPGFGEVLGLVRLYVVVGGGYAKLRREKSAMGTGGCGVLGVGGGLTRVVWRVFEEIYFWGWWRGGKWGSGLAEASAEADSRRE